MHGVSKVIRLQNKAWYYPEAMRLISTWTLQRRSARVTIKEGVELNKRLIKQVEAELAGHGD